MNTTSTKPDPFRGLRFHRSLRDAYGYDVELMRTDPVSGWGRKAMVWVAAAAVLLILAVRL